MVIGLGRFGSALARTLIDLGHEVLGVDRDPALVADLRDVLTHVVEADTTDIRALEQMAASDFDRVVVAIGTDMEASILTVAALGDAGVGEIWAKAMTDTHGRILERVGAHHVVYPEAQMGVRTAHLLDGAMLDFVALDPGFVLVEMRAPRSLTGRSLGEQGIRTRFDVTVVCVKPVDASFTYATADTVLSDGDIIVIAADTARAEAFARLR
jgi:trk system potassium uptake protein TrkA